MTILNPPQSVVTAKAQIALLHAEIDARLAKAQATLTEMAANAETPEEAARFSDKAKGVAFVAGSHVERIFFFEGPSEVLGYCDGVSNSVDRAGWSQGFAQGVDLALGYIRGYVN